MGIIADYKLRRAQFKQQQANDDFNKMITAINLGRDIWSKINAPAEEERKAKAEADRKKSEWGDYGKQQYGEKLSMEEQH